MKINRRCFLKNTAITAGAFAMPTIVPASVFGKTAPSNKIHIGCIGVGGRGSGLLGTLYNKQAQVVAVSDCFASRRQTALNTIKDIYTKKSVKQIQAPKGMLIFRELLARPDIDGVIIATQDHWHVPLAMYAIQAGKDMYVEKPLGVSVDDAFKLRKLVQDKGTVFQYGTQQRSAYYFRFACELVRNGYIGKLEKIDAWCAGMLDQVESEGYADYVTKMPPDQPVQPDLNYDRWIGPAPMKPYCDLRCTNLGTYHINDYAIGFIAGWGASLDIAQWGNDSENTAPIHYEGTGTFPTGGLFDTVSRWDMHCTYANGVKMHFMDLRTANPIVSRYNPKMIDHGTTFHGSEGWISVRRGDINFSDESLRRIKLKDTEIHLEKSENHMANFVDCIKTRKKPVSTIEAAVQSDMISHLCNAAIRLKQPVEWDPKTEKAVKNQDEVNGIINRSLRAPWCI